MIGTTNYDAWRTAAPEPSECPDCGGAAEIDRYEGRCIAGGYNEAEDRYGCGWWFEQLPFTFDN